MQDKWNIRKKNGGYLKIHFAAVDIDTKELLTLEVTDNEKLHDGKIMKTQLVVEHNLENKNMMIESVLAKDDGDGCDGRGGAYDSNRNFKYLQKRRYIRG